jgi:Ni/Fe-hydrogenase subunit HybB-like protein
VQVRDGMAPHQHERSRLVGTLHRQLHLLVGLAAGGVMMVIPAYLYHDEEMHDVVIIGELLAIAAIVMCADVRRL